MRDWAKAQGGTAIGLVVDHGLRPESAAEAAWTCAALAGQGIEPTLLPLTGLARGPALAERARAARHAALEAACAARGVLHLVFGHHAGDQAETLLMRAARNSGATGMAGMAALSETTRIRRLRPLLGTPPGRLRATLREAGLGWIEDPSNADPSSERARIRAARADPDGAGTATRGLIVTSLASGNGRRVSETVRAKTLGREVDIHPEGWALCRAGTLPADALAALIGALSGALRAPLPAMVEDVAARLRPATLGGVRILQAGRLGPGWLLVREEAAMEPPVPAVPSAEWDGRFRLAAPAPEGATLGAWGDDAPSDRLGLPAAIRRTLPVLRHEGRILGSLPGFGFAPLVQPWPRRPAAGAPFLPLRLAAGWDHDAGCPGG